MAWRHEPDAEGLWWRAPVARDSVGEPRLVKVRRNGPDLDWWDADIRGWRHHDAFELCALWCRVVQPPPLPDVEECERCCGTRFVSDLSSDETEILGIGDTYEFVESYATREGIYGPWPSTDFIGALVSKENFLPCRLCGGAGYVHPQVPT